jgi:hypothetical protein
MGRNPDAGPGGAARDPTSRYPGSETRSTGDAAVAVPEVCASLTGTLAAAIPYLPTVLVSLQARRTLDDITDRIPAALTRRIYLECRLAERAPRIDLVLGVDRSSRTLLMEAQRAWVPEKMRAHPLWTGLSDLCSHWTDERSSIGAWVHDLWLEFDGDGHLAERDALMPNVFVGLMRGPTAPQVLDAALACLETVTNRPVDPHAAAAARNAVAKLPRGTTLPYIGVMYPRGRRAIRVCVAPLAGAALLDYLRSIGWPGGVNELEALLRSIPCGGFTSALDRTTLVHLDLLDGVQPHIGLEIHLRQDRQVIAGRVERELFDHLCDRRLCACTKRDALLGWPGYAFERFPHQCWPSVALRRISHVKIVHEPGRRAELKTYLSFFHGALKRRPARRNSTSTSDDRTDGSHTALVRCAGTIRRQHERAD